MVLKLPFVLVTRILNLNTPVSQMRNKIPHVTDDIYLIMSHDTSCLNFCTVSNESNVVPASSATSLSGYVSDDEESQEEIIARCTNCNNCLQGAVSWSIRVDREKLSNANSIATEWNEKGRQFNVYGSISKLTRSARIVDENGPQSSKMFKNKQNMKEPLLPVTKKKSKIERKRKYLEANSDTTTITIGNNENESNHTLTAEEEQRLFPREVWKTVLACVIMVFELSLSILSLALIHEYVPDRETYEPLPDLLLSNIPEQPWALDVSEYLISITISSVCIMMLFHKYRFIVFRRIFLIVGLLYFYRAVTFFVTILPVSSKSYTCAPKEPNVTTLIIIKRVFNMMSGFGLSLNDDQPLCGDYIYSGHTAILTAGYLFVAEYTPKRFISLRIIYGLITSTGIVMLIVAHGHYTVDVIIAYFITTRLFWTYHTLANTQEFKKKGLKHNYLAGEWWIYGFRYFEMNVGAPLPCIYNWPLPWPKGFQKDFS